MVETGAKFGTVMAYDGTGMTAGLDQHVAVYPRELSRPDDGNALDDQGTLWKLLRRIEMIPHDLVGIGSGLEGSGPILFLDDVREKLWGALSHEMWYLAQDGVLRSEEKGEPISGEEIRQIFTPHKGKVVELWQKKQARFWAELFHNLFSHPDTHQAQQEYGIEHLVKRTKRRKIMTKFKGQRVLHGTVHQLAYDRLEITAVRMGPDLIPELDLALCMYQAHSVNAPAIANKALKASLYARSDQLLFAQVLIFKLGNSKYGRWDDDLKYGRYQRTRAAARASKLWPKDLFDGKGAIMPKDLPG